MSIDQLIHTDAWQLTGWTMLHTLWIGSLVGVVAAGVRVLLHREPLRRWAPNLCYAGLTGLLGFLALLPVGIAGRLTWQGNISKTISAESAPLRSRTTDPLGLVSNSPDPLGSPLDNEYQANRVPTEIQTQTQLSRRITANATTNQSISKPSNPHLLSWGLGKQTLQGAITWLPWLWITGAPLTFFLLAMGLIGTGKLRQNSQPLTSGPIHQACQRLGQTLGMARPIAVALCDRITGPVLVGIVRPLILLPTAAVGGWSPEQLEMVLLHELAHIRRYDNLVNLLQRAVEGLLFFHPAVWILSHWIREEREICCDALVVTHTGQPREYAELLVTLASAHRGSQLTLATSMAQPPLAGRIRNILQIKEEPMRVSRRAVGMVVALLFMILTLVTCYLPGKSEAEPVEIDSSEKQVVEKTKSQTLPKEILDRFLTSHQTQVNLQDSLIEWTTAKEREVFRETQLALIKSPFILETVLKDARLNALMDSLSIGFPDPLTWLQHNLNVSFPDNGNIMQVQLTGPNATQEQLSDLCQAIVDRYLEEIQPQQASKTNPHFLSLADQLNADLAYRRLGIELEPLSQEEMSRVQAMKFSGGLRVTDTMGMSPFHKGDLLVGLHVWKTSSLQELGELLVGDDLRKFSSLKFYVLRNPTGDGGGVEPDPAHDRLTTGRTHILNQDHDWENASGNRYRQTIGQTPKTSNQPRLFDSSTTANSVFNPSALRFDGKSFDQWNSLWRLELKPERRLEAIQAMATFGRVGFEEQAAESILNVALEYDFQVLDGSPEGKLKSSVIRLLTTHQGLVPYWLPILQTRLDHNHAKSKWLGVHLISSIRTEDPSIINHLMKLTKNPNFHIRHAALTALCRSELGRNNPETFVILKQALATDDSEEIRMLLGILKVHSIHGSDSAESHAHMQDIASTLFPFLFHARKNIRQIARMNLSQFPEEHLHEVAAELVLILQNPSRAPDHLQAARALSAIGESRLPEGTLQAIESFSSGKKLANNLDLLVALVAGFPKLAEQISYSETHRDGLISEKKLRDRVEKEQAQIYPDLFSGLNTVENGGFGGGTGGGTGGGGGFF